MINNSNYSSGGTWRGLYAELKAARDEFARYSGIMTPYERAAVTRSLEDKQQRFRASIANGAIGEFNQALNSFRYAQAQAKAAHKSELNRWDASKLAAEMQAIKMMIDSQLSMGPQQEDFTGSNPEDIQRSAG